MAKKVNRLKYLEEEKKKLEIEIDNYTSLDLLDMAEIAKDQLKSIISMIEDLKK